MKSLQLGDHKDHKQLLFHKIKILIDRIDMIARVRKQRVRKINHKEKLLGKLLDGYRMKNKNQFSKTIFFFDFSNPLKQIMIKSRGTKTLLKIY